MYSTELVKGTLQTIILKLLYDNGRMYGYEITQKVLELSDEKIQLTEGSLYPTLHKLESEGYLETEIVFLGKRKRKYYKLTQPGHSSLKSKLSEMSDFISTVSKLLKIQPDLSWS